MAILDWVCPKGFYVDAGSITYELGFLKMYLYGSYPEGVAILGGIRDIFWDAVLDGGPRLPGECEIAIVRSADLRMIYEGDFHRFLEGLAFESRVVRARLELPVVAGRRHQRQEGYLA
ncbi:hypothetical protein [Stenotrophomonas maltophilia]|uniref:hypothetical protein n=1 Tax=Stenotrophomonas maltophilia TaxID=40324 RepID=UPI000E24EB56|nr:hypothetical protein [Stenotrophomonas maltophilia]MCI1125087.1 hypothetical protein [Stenotrophomonas maltophilia]REC84272.1 hypothetical protein DXT57_14795 [Stenotrophomonas maltophilia]HEL3791144.1 hypothetical protein [Stenotrophomonas maltophilia]